MKIVETVDNSPCSKTLTVEVGVEEIKKEIDSVYGELSKHAQIPGFRPGHAPLHLLQLRFGRAVRKEAEEKVTEKACQEALEELKLQVIGEPQVTPVEKKEEGEKDETEKDETEKDKAGKDKAEKAPDEKEEEEFGAVPLKFKLEFEYVPAFDVEGYDGLEVEVPRIEVTNEQVDGVLERSRQRMAILVPAPEDHVIAKDDIVTLSVQATCEGEPFPEATDEDFMLEIGYGQYLPGFEEALMGLKVGDEKDIELEIPDSYPIEQYRGKQACFEVRVRQISQRQLPELDDEFAKDLGEYESLEQLRRRIREGLQEEADRRKQDAAKAALRNRLVEKHPIPVPERMIEAEFRYINALQNLELARLGTSFDALGDKGEILLNENRQRAQQRVRARLLLEKVAEKESMKLSEAEFFEFIEGMAAERGTDPDRFVRQMQKKEMTEYYQQLALENKVLNFLLEKAKVVEVEPPRDEALKPASQEAAGEKV